MTIYLYPMNRFTGKLLFNLCVFEWNLIADNMNVIYKVYKITLDVNILHTGELDVWFRSGFHIKIYLVDYTINFHLCLLACLCHIQ